MTRNTLILLAVVWTAALGLIGFSELRAESSSQSSQQTSRQAAGEDSASGDTQRETTRREPGGRDGGRGERDEPERAESSDKAGPDGVRLQLAGQPGVEFSGSCSVDGEERELEGRTPQTYDYEPEERLECRLSSGGGALRVTFSGGDTSSTQQVGPGSSSLELTYTADGLSASTSSRSGESSRVVSSQTSSSQTSSSQSSVTSSSAVTQSGSE